MKYHEAVRLILGIPNLTSGAKVVLLSLYDRQGRKKSSWPSVGTIGKDCGLARASVVRAIRELGDKNLVKVTRPARPAVGRTNKYSVHLASIVSRPVQKLNPFRNDTPTGIDSELEPVSILNPNVLSERTNRTNPFNGPDSEGAPTGNAETLFENARQLYPGTKRSNSTEFKDFKSHKDWKHAAPLLEPAIRREMEYKSGLRTAEKFCPDWKHFKTWINQRCWEQEFPVEDENQLTHECDPDVAMELERSVMA